MFVRHILLVVITTTMLIGSSGCMGVPCIDGEGSSVRREVTVEEFHGIQVEGSLDVRFTQGPTRVEMEGQANVLDGIVIEVRNGICHVHAEQCFSTKVPVLVHLSAPALAMALVNGSGSINATGTLTTTELTAQVQGSGDVSLNCTATTVRATVNGSGDVRLNGSCNQLDATVNGSGDVLCWWSCGTVNPTQFSVRRSPSHQQLLPDPSSIEQISRRNFGPSAVR